MRLREEIRLYVGILLLVQALTMIAAVGLLARMTPAIDQILEENEKSIRAVEQMSLALAAEPGADPQRAASQREAFERALAVAHGNITEPAEAPVIAEIERRYEAALARDPDAAERVRGRLVELSEINRRMMLEADARAKRLGTAGAWSIVFLGLVGLFGSIALLRRARVKLITPVYELGSVLNACEGGDRHRRVTLRGAATEFHEFAAIVNALVDERFARRERGWERTAKLERLALLAALDEAPAPTLVCDRSGELVAANAAALELLRTRGDAVRARVAGARGRGRARAPARRQRLALSARRRGRARRRGADGRLGGAGA
ncbi:MAG: hypothetical protein H6713_31920 [Myxococcales bacterium]|nr:hypothetical protein [Myxococcales bacterium]